METTTTEPIWLWKVFHIRFETQMQIHSQLIQIAINIIVLENNWMRFINIAYSLYILCRPPG